MGDAAARCQERPGGDTTLGISECLMAETGVWAALMQEAYDQKLDTLRETDQSLPEALRQSQEAWAAYRDAACGLQYQIWLQGSIRVIIAGNCHLRKTAARAHELSGLGELD
ncbi:lysozyme inhibitor LprI family protein [uncultured Roseovarius sp.]|uniref:lysozyme inhibitor LprI family protein n=1 Tax=uncultured Roseovarius sp. TaxID=293344 RepID=UPI002615650A|nr:lysozyme inhibitor LprI family protein [uncultured Roseovarius sp.]